MLLVYVVPQIVSVYQQSRQTLPLLTRALIATQRVLPRDRLATGSRALAAAMRRVRGRAAPRRRFARAGTALLLRTPVIGRLLRSLDTARFASTLAILAGSGAPLLRALDAAADVDAHAAAARGGARVAGRSCAKACRSRARCASRGCSRRCSCTSSPTASRAARWRRCSSARPRELEREAERRLTWLAALIQPALIVAMGAIVLVLVLAVMLPIVSMNQLIR